MAAKKLTEALNEKPRIPCAGHIACRYPGRLWVRTLQPHERLCVDHYCDWIYKHPQYRHDDTVPPKPSQMLEAKNVTGEMEDRKPMSVVK